MHVSGHLAVRVGWGIADATRDGQGWHRDTRIESMTLNEVGFKGGSVQSQILQCLNSVSMNMPARLALHQGVPHGGELVGIHDPIGYSLCLHELIKLDGGEIMVYCEGMLLFP